MQYQYKEVYEKGTEILETAGVPDARLDARLLLEAVCRTDRTYLYAHGDRELTETEQSNYEKLLDRRKKRIPLQHILGYTEFMGLQFKVNENVLCPRQDTEILVEETMKHLHDGMRVLDMCTGSGCILLSLLKYANDCTGVGADLSEKALEVAAENSALLNIPAEFIQGNLFERVEGKFDIIVSNPPYIRSDLIPTLMEEVRDNEPMIALDGKEDGLFFYREIIKNAGKYLWGGGKLLFEIGFDQGADVTALMEENGYREVKVLKDYAGLDRVVYGEWKCLIN